MAKDVICGMQVDPKTAAAKSEFKGTTYYFCAQSCKVAFDKDPERYIADADETSTHRHSDTKH